MGFKTPSNFFFFFLNLFLNKKCEPSESTCRYFHKELVQNVSAMGKWSPAQPLATKSDQKSGGKAGGSEGSYQMLALGNVNK